MTPGIYGFPVLSTEPPSKLKRAKERKEKKEMKVWQNSGLNGIEPMAPSSQLGGGHFGNSYITVD